ncbi:tyrosine-type recombinase/integrase, partial [bacterium]|nr:tyrosine-type recombinase/integrase [bacterium]
MMSRRAEARTKILPEQLKILEEFDRDNHINGLTEETCKNKLKELLVFCREVKKPIDKVTKEDIKTYFSEFSYLKPASITMKKSHVKTFFKWHEGTDEYPEIVRWIRVGFAKSNKRIPESVLTPTEVKQIIDAATRIQHKAMIAVLYDTACRLGELVGMGLNEIQYDENGAFVVIDGKTGRRIARIIHSMPYLSLWLEHHPLRNDKSKNVPLWISETNITKNQPLTKQGVHNIIRLLREEVDINKKISAHQFRHARLTDLARKGLNEPTLKVIAGWEGNSTMPQVYLHLSGEDGANKLLEAEKEGYVRPKAKDNPLKPQLCARCGFENGSTTRYCGRCGNPTNETEILINDPLKIITGMSQAFHDYESS